jgi:hypothetical protein
MKHILYHPDMNASYLMPVFFSSVAIIGWMMLASETFPPFRQFGEFIYLAMKLGGTLVATAFAAVSIFLYFHDLKSCRAKQMSIES